MEEKFKKMNNMDEIKIKEKSLIIKVLVSDEDKVFKTEIIKEGFSEKDEISSIMETVGIMKVVMEKEIDKFVKIKE
jgi:hypothetical protein